MQKTFVPLGNVVAQIRHEAAILKPHAVVDQLERGEISADTPIAKQLKIHDVVFLQEQYTTALRLTGPQMESLFSTIVELEEEIGVESVPAGEILASMQDEI